MVSHGQENLAAYRKSLPGPPRAYSDLKTADLRSEQALKLIPDYELATQLNDEVHAEVSKFIDEGRHEVGLYQEARKGRTPGYVHLVAAQDLVNACADMMSRDARVWKWTPVGIRKTQKVSSGYWSLEAGLPRNLNN